MVTRIRDLAEAIDPLLPNLSANAAMRRFNLNPQAEFLPVARDGVPLGILKRRSVLEWLAGVRLTQDTNQVKVLELMVADPLIVDVEASLAYIAAKQRHRLSDGILATRDGLYAGFVQPASALSALAIENKKRAQVLKGLKGQLQQERAAQRAKLTDQSRYLSVIGHEIRTPLTGVLGVADLLCDSGLSKEARGLAETISSSGRMLERLLSDILDLSRLEAGKMPVTTETFKLEEFASDVRRLWAQQAAAKGVSLSVRCQSRAAKRIEADGVRLRQILFNLVSNAVKFTQSGAITVDLRVHSNRQSGLALVMTVTDTGPGISASDKERLFQAFEQASPETVRRFGGTGLGLTIAKSLTERLGGTITVSDNPQGGAVFSITCPIRRAGARLAVENARMRAANLELGHILVADDHDISRLVMKKALSAAGWTVSTAASAEDARRLLQSTSYQAVLLDLRFGDQSGIEMARELRTSDGPNGETVLVATTADVTEAVETLCYQSGFDAFIPKPMRPRELVANLIDVLLHRERAVTSGDGAFSALAG